MGLVELTIAQRTSPRAKGFSFGVCLLRVNAIGLAKGSPEVSRPAPGSPPRRPPAAHAPARRHRGLGERRAGIAAMAPGTAAAARVKLLRLNPRRFSMPASRIIV